MQPTLLGAIKKGYDKSMLLKERRVWDIPLHAAIEGESNVGHWVARGRRPAQTDCWKSDWRLGWTLGCMPSWT